MNANATGIYTPVDPFSCQWEIVFNEIRNLDRYGVNWDGEGANAVRFNLIRTAFEWLKEMRTLSEDMLPDSIYPTVGGTIMIEWHPSGGYPITAHIRVPELVEVVFHDGNSPQFQSIKVATATKETYENTIAKRDDPSDYLQYGKYCLAA